MPSQSHPCKSLFPRLVWSDARRSDVPEVAAELDLRLERAVAAMEQLAAALRVPERATPARRLAIELTLARIDEQLMLATRAHFAMGEGPCAHAPGVAR